MSGAFGPFMDQAGRRGSSQCVPVVRARRHMTIQRSDEGPPTPNPDVQSILKDVPRAAICTRNLPFYLYVTAPITNPLRSRASLPI